MARFHGKKPKGGIRIAAPEVPITTDHQTPVFCLHYLEGKYCLSACDQEEKAAFADTLHRLSKRTWSELLQLSKYKKGCEKLPQSAIKGGGLPSILTPDNTLLVFRFSGMKAMVGFRNRAIFHILWLDRDFSLYDHGG